MSKRKSNAKARNQISVACKAEGVSPITLFRRAHRKKFGLLDEDVVRTAYQAYRKIKMIPKWVIEYVQWLLKPRTPVSA